MYYEYVSRLRPKMNLSSKWATLCLHETRWFWSTRTFHGKHELWHWIIFYLKNKKTNRRGSYSRPRKQNFKGVRLLGKYWANNLSFCTYIHTRLIISAVSCQNESNSHFVKQKLHELKICNVLELRLVMKYINFYTFYSLHCICIIYSSTTEKIKVK